MPKQIDPEVSMAKVELRSKRGKKIENSGKQCNECGYSNKILWLYSKSNFGPVYLCSRCKPKVFDRSFGEVDALRMSLPGHYGGNSHRQ